MSKIKNNAPLTIGEGINKQALSRRFLGNIFPKNCFENKELQAYLKGQTHFTYKTRTDGSPQYYPVRQEYFYKPSV